MIYSGDPMLVELGIVLFVYAILVNAPRNFAMPLHHTIPILRPAASP